ncbi:MAG TPA: hypothetical protein PLM24_04530 [Methanothrix sp.]|nr:hypothetical protein [Methanothrix sp.]HPJ84246.1 hypothetical protein [Methanothrix sp.]HPR66384.1 hypothetical protein [Methanothrix sp.]
MAVLPIIVYFLDLFLEQLTLQSGDPLRIIPGLQGSDSPPKPGDSDLRADLPEGNKLPFGVNIIFSLQNAPPKQKIASKWIRDI